MPKLIDYAARFEFFRRAAFLVVRDRGPQALSRRAVAAALGTSFQTVLRLLSEEADLRHLALDEVDRRRRRGRWGRPRELAGAGLAVFLLRTLVPDEEGRVAEELVWLRLAIDAHRPVVPDEESVAALRAEHAIAERGYAPDGNHQAPPSVPDDRLVGRLDERDELVECVVIEALTAIGVDAEAEQRRTRVLVDGLALGTCLGRTTPGEAVAILEEHVASLVREARMTA